MQCGSLRCISVRFGVAIRHDIAYLWVVKTKPRQESPAERREARMNATEIKARDQATVSKVVGAGHNVQYGWSIDRKGRWSVYLQIWHCNDTKRNIGTSTTQYLDAWFHDAASAKSYAIIMKTGAAA
jgi:hypothetical protein